MPSPQIGILALQGDFKEHAVRFRELGCDVQEIRRVSELSEIDALVLPGGESTAVAILEGAEAEFGHSDGIFQAIREQILRGLPTWGTCMGSILLAKNIEGSKQGRLAVMDITVQRNAFGAQRWSGELDLSIPAFGDDPFHGVFIRAPIITSVGKNVEVLSRIEKGIAMAREKNMLATVFHPEVVTDLRVHEYFLAMTK